MKHNVLIIGGGNIGTLIAADLSDKANVTVYNSSHKEWSDRITVFNSDDTVQFVSSRIYITDDLEKAVTNAKFIFVTVPSFMFADIAEKIGTYVTDKQIICIVPGSGGAEFAFRKLIDKGVKFIGFQRVHCIARLKKYGDSVYALGRKKQIELASIPSDLAEKLSGEVSGLFSMPCKSISNYLCLTLTPSNPILHPSRLYALFRDYDKKQSYGRNPLFYEEWDDDASRNLLEMDDELQCLCNTIPLDLHEVISLKEHYESFTVETMTAKIRSIEAFKGIYTPMKKDQSGYWKPDFSSRYFTSDFDFGLKILRDIAEIFNVKTPLIDAIYNWYCNTTNVERNTFNVNLSREEFLKIYR